MKIDQAGFHINHSKSGVFTPEDRPKITGYRVGNRITLDRAFRKDLRRLICKCLRDAPSKHVYSYPRSEKMKHYGTVNALRRHLTGKMCRLQVEPIQHTRFKRLYDQIDWDR